jgi:hypothetical protein
MAPILKEVGEAASESPDPQGGRRGCIRDRGRGDRGESEPRARGGFWRVRELVPARPAVRDVSCITLATRSSSTPRLSSCSPLQGGRQLRRVERQIARSTWALVGVPLGVSLPTVEELGGEDEALRRVSRCRASACRARDGHSGAEAGWWSRRRGWRWSRERRAERPLSHSHPCYGVQHLGAGATQVRLRSFPVESERNLHAAMRSLGAGAPRRHAALAAAWFCSMRSLFASRRRAASSSGT